MRILRDTAVAAVLALALGACGDRDDSFDEPVANVTAIGLEGQVALVDPGLERVVLLSPKPGLTLDRASIPVGKGVVRAEASKDGKRLFVLSAGDVPRRKGKDEKPALTVIEAGQARRYPLASPRSGFVVDPLGRWVALFKAPNVAGSPVTTQFVENPNEIVLVDLQKGVADAGAVVSRTLRSFGGIPQRVSFTPVLQLPGGARRLLVVETQQDVTLLDLDNVAAVPERPEITVRLTSGATAKALTPAGVVFDDGDPARSDDARIGVRIVSDPNVFTLTLVPSNATEAAEPGTVPNDFRPEVNLTDVGGPPGDIAFVHTAAGGLRLAAVVPGLRKAVLVDPTTSITTDVTLPGSYERIALVTNEVGGGAGADTALLYGSRNGEGVAFWSLDRPAGTEFRSVEALPIAANVASVLDVLPPRQQLKILEAGNQFFVLDLATRTASPLVTTSTPTLHVAADGQRLWAFSRNTSELAQVALDKLRPASVPLDRSIAAVFDTAYPGGRALVALHDQGAWGATVLDAIAPDPTLSHSYSGLLLEGLR